MLFGRVASVAARLGQSVITTDNTDQVQLPPGQLQLYVDDPIATTNAKAQDARLLFDVLLTFWQILVIPLSWKKGRSAQSPAS